MTSNAGWDAIKHQDFLREAIAEFKQAGIRVSVFIDTDCKNIEAAAKTGTDRVELYTEPYAVGYLVNKEKAIAPFIKAAQCVKDIGLGLNAGHDLSLINLKFI